MDIFLLIGAPHILQSDNGREFTASVITELKELWPDLVLVHGKPRHPQSQGSVERLNCDIKDILVSWLHDNNSSDWAMGLKFVQFMKNSSHHSAIKQTPYKALFGCEPRVGLRSSNLPVEVIQNMMTEEDLINFRAQCQSNETQDISSEESQLAAGASPSTSAASQSASDASQSAAGASQSASDASQSTSAASESTSAASQSTSAASESTSAASQSAAGASQSTSAASQSTSTVDQTRSEADRQSSSWDQHVESDSGGESNEQLSTSESIHSSRKRAREGILKQAQRMIKRSRLENVPGNVGDNVTIPIPLVDRGRGDSRNIVGLIVSRDENDLYKIAVKGGVLNGKYSRNQFDLCNYALLTINDVSQDNEISLREAVQCESNCGGQGFLRCNCSGTARCQTNRCKCFKAKIKCNSRCHSALNCNNKN
jgi:hypothetical protein